MDLSFSEKKHRFFSNHFSYAETAVSHDKEKIETPYRVKKNRA